MICPVCHGAFAQRTGRGRPWKYCSDECRTQYRRTQYIRLVAPVDRICVVCRREFKGRPDRKYCSPACRSRRPRDLVKARARDRTPKRREAQRRRYKERKQRLWLERAARDFQRALVIEGPLMLVRAPILPRVPKWTPEYKRKRDRERRWESRGRPVLVAGYCQECATAFVGSGRPRYCSSDCARRHARRIAKWRRKRSFKGQRQDVIRLPKLALRDGWLCHICRRKVVRKTWSVDHLIPRAHGGMHTWENVALAHHRCNTLRGATGEAQLLLVG